MADVCACAAGISPAPQTRAANNKLAVENFVCFIGLSPCFEVDLKLTVETGLERFPVGCFTRRVAFGTCIGCRQFWSRGRGWRGLDQGFLR
jgi:hypothetical protein